MGCTPGRLNNSASNTHQITLQETEQGSDILLENPNGSGDAVNLQAQIADGVGHYTLTRVRADGLAFKAGLRSDDQLIGINGKTIEKYSLQYVLQFLREGIQSKLLLELKRSHSGCTKYVWSFFELSVQEGNPAIEVISLLETDIDVIPTNILDATISWTGAPVNAFDIYLPDEKLYLGIDDGRVSFMTYDKKKCTFYRYNYDGGDSSQGNVVAYTQQNFKPPPSMNRNTPAAKKDRAKPEVDTMHFPTSMVTQWSFPPDPRLWYEKIAPTGDQRGRTLESMTQQGKFPHFHESVFNTLVHACLKLCRSESGKMVATLRKFQSSNRPNVDTAWLLRATMFSIFRYPFLAVLVNAFMGRYHCNCVPVLTSLLLFSFMSLNVGWYLAKSPTDNTAILSELPAVLGILPHEVRVGPTKTTGAGEA
ncbi:uncharacterized protein LOC110982626 isoform X2 [Acanthaster planci]|uniref:Uncharacterized protein LOC110982626 isoform X2 n=1 Tax=Acanthaster planci TaxID=133434 RepID=A0A8B7YU99_ACAPL|nr:uncharacterized protein LOC110982626 isoform X2 [Acanthaster planci]XP_022096874.1 uncharacterized protein LOC110982626 isoform X2 [Acanthaster planci]